MLTEEWVLFPQSTSEGRLLSSFGSFEPLFQNFALSHETCELPEAVRSHKRTNSYKGNQLTPHSYLSKVYFSEVIE